MNLPDLERARQYALDRLVQELSPHLYYHCVEHTRDDVVPAVERLAAGEGVTGEDLLLVLTAAYFHDLGFVEQYYGNEQIGAHIAAEVLPGFDYSPAQVAIVSDLIMATQLPQRPRNHLAEIMADADLDVLGRDDFMQRNRALQQEVAYFGRPATGLDWYRSQLEFIRSHRYFTATARQLRLATKQANIKLLAQMLDQSQPAALFEFESEGALLTNSDKVAILRSVNIFAATPDDILSELAELLTPIEVAAGETIVQKGDAGDCMYIIESGQVRVHDGELMLNTLAAGDVFGEMALLDVAPRVASVTASERTQLFRLDQAPFYQMMASQPEVPRGVIQVLCRHLRARVRDMKQDFDYIQQMNRIAAAAAALEAGRFDSRSLDEVGQRDDELGQLARVFQKMANEVQAREQRLKRQVQELRIQIEIDVAKRQQQVNEIVESTFFGDLQAQAARMRARRQPSEGDETQNQAPATHEAADGDHLEALREQVKRLKKR